MRKTIALLLLACLPLQWAGAVGLGHCHAVGGLAGAKGQAVAEAIGQGHGAITQSSQSTQSTQPSQADGQGAGHDHPSHHGHSHPDPGHDRDDLPASSAHAGCDSCPLCAALVLPAELGWVMPPLARSTVSALAVAWPAAHAQAPYRPPLPARA